jgi:hypothetical protein
MVSKQRKEPIVSLPTSLPHHKCTDGINAKEIWSGLLKD